MRAVFSRVQILVAATTVKVEGCYSPGFLMHRPLAIPSCLLQNS